MTRKKKEIKVITEEKKIPRLLVGVPHMGTFPYEFLWAFLKLMRRTMEYTDLDVDTHFIGSSLIHDARERIVEYALDTQCDYILFLDSDMVFDDTIIEDLIKYNLDIISGLYFKRFPPYTPIFYKNIAAEDDIDTKFVAPAAYGEGLIECDGLGGGCLLVKTDVFRKIKAEQGVPTWFPILLPSGKAGLGEDLSFCYRATQAGFKMYVDTTTKCGHVGVIIANEVACQAVIENELRELEMKKQAEATPISTEIIEEKPKKRVKKNASKL